MVVTIISEMWFEWLWTSSVNTNGWRQEKIDRQEWILIRRKCSWYSVVWGSMFFYVFAPPCSNHVLIPLMFWATKWLFPCHYIMLKRSLHSFCPSELWKFLTIVCYCFIFAPALSILFDIFLSLFASLFAIEFFPPLSGSTATCFRNEYNFSIISSLLRTLPSAT